MNLEAALRSLHAEFYGPDDCEARDYLWDRGFYLDTECRWHVPNGFKIMPKDYRAVLFLVVESGFDRNVIEDAEETPPHCRQH
jgi:hypothetical protein